MNPSSGSRYPEGGGGGAGGAGGGDGGKDKRPLSARLGIRLALAPEGGREGGQGGSCRGGSTLRDEVDAGEGASSSNRRTTTSTTGHGSSSSSSSSSGGGGCSRAEREEQAGTPMTIRALEASRKVVAKLKTAGINFMALDFDMTVLDIHTGTRSLVVIYLFIFLFYLVVLFIKRVITSFTHLSTISPPKA